MGETPVTLTIHGVQLTASLAILCILLREHKVWIRLKDRLNQLWKDRCDSRGDNYFPLDENGH